MHEKWRKAFKYVHIYSQVELSMNPGTLQLMKDFQGSRDILNCGQNNIDIILTSYKIVAYDLDSRYIWDVVLGIQAFIRDSALKPVQVICVSFIRG